MMTLEDFLTVLVRTRPILAVLGGELVVDGEVEWVESLALFDHGPTGWRCKIITGSLEESARRGVGPGMVLAPGFLGRENLESADNARDGVWARVRI